MINTLISAALGIILYGAAIGHFYSVMQTYNKIQIKFARQQEKLIARQLIGQDLFMKTLAATTCKIGKTCSSKLEKANILPLSDVLILHTSHHDIIYSLRKSVLSRSGTIIKYALYREDTQHLPQAIVENVKNMRVQILALPLHRQRIIVSIEFLDNYILEVACTLPH